MPESVKSNLGRFTRHLPMLVCQGWSNRSIIVIDHNGGLNMETLSLSEAKMKLSELIEKV